jgi:hypothetical protein
MIAFSQIGLLLGATRKRPTSPSSKANNQKPVHAYMEHNSPSNWASLA